MRDIVRAAVLTVCMIAGIQMAAGAVITSTSTGGRWDQAATWVGGAVPTASDDVVIDGTVILYENTLACSSLTVNAGDTLFDWYSIVLNVGGNVTNNGAIIRPGAYGFTMNVDGNIVQNGVWDDISVRFTGTSDQNVQCRGGNYFTSCYMYDDDSTSSVTADSTLLLYDTRFDLQGGLIELNGAGIAMTGGYIKDGSVLASGQVITMDHVQSYHEGYVMNLAVSGAELQGYFSVRDNVVFYDSVTVTDTLINYYNEINTIGVQGAIRNNGTVTVAGAYGLYIYLYGDVVNNGVWSRTRLHMAGSGTQDISCLGGAYFYDGYLYDDDSTSATTVSTALTLDKMRVDLQGGDLELDGTPLSLTGGYMTGGTVHCDWGDFTMGHNESYHEAYLEDINVSGAVLRGYFSVKNGVAFTDSVAVEDTLTNYFNTSNVARIEGHIVNNGVITKAGAYGFTLQLTGSIVNNGQWTNTQNDLVGTDDQEVLLQGDAPLQSPVTAYANISGGSFQWYVNGDAIDGYTDSTSGADSLTAMNYGTSYCISDNDTSRRFFIWGGELIARFGADARIGHSPLTVNFEDFTLGDPTTWSWSFGDKQSSTAQHPANTYANGGSYDVTLVVSDGSTSDTLTYSSYIEVADGDDDFETGDFSTYAWQHGGDSAWTLTGDGAIGAYSARSGNITHRGTSNLSVTLMVDTGTVSFYRKVSSEDGYDELMFYIDGVLQGSWSGEEDWALASYEVSTGEHTFLWRYAKDSGVDDGDDAAWIDAISFPDEYETAAVGDTGTVTFAGAGVTVTFVDSLTGSGDVGALLFTESPPDQPTADAPVKRYFSVITDGGISGFRAALTLSYDQADIDASDITDETSLYCARWDGSAWVPFGSIVDTAANTVTCTTTQFSLWSIGGEGAPMPVTLTAFTGAATPAGNELAWETTDETDLLGFNVLRADAAGGPFAQVNGALVPAGTGAYAFTDASAPAGCAYYRLQAVNTDGTTETLGTISIEGCISGILNGTGDAPVVLRALPNPVPVGMVIRTGAAFTGTMTVTDLQGRTIASANGADALLTLPGTSGRYQLTVQENGSQVTRQLVMIGR